MKELINSLFKYGNEIKVTLEIDNMHTISFTMCKNKGK